MPEFPEPFKITLPGTHDPDGAQEPPIEMSVHSLGEGGGRPPVVFCHGFPELGYSWRHQLPAVSEAGFRAIAPDQRGYGGTSAPTEVDAYGLGQLCGDLVDMLDVLEIERAVFVGHDWGGFVAWAMPALHPDRVEAVVGVCTPYTPFPETEFLRAMFDDDDKMYMLWFQQPEVPESVMDGNVREMFERLMIGGIDPAVLLEANVGRAEGMDFNPFRNIADMEPMGETFAEPAELDHYVEVFERTGFRGAINWYRNMDTNAAGYPHACTVPLSIPTLMITAEWDPALPPALAANMGSKCSDLETHMVPKAGHWVQQECPEQVNAILVDWLSRRFG